MGNKNETRSTDKKEFTLITYSKFGGICNVARYPNKTRATSQGRTMKRNGLCKSYQVYDDTGSVVQKG